MSKQVTDAPRWFRDDMRGFVTLIRAGTTIPPFGEPASPDALVVLNQYELHLLIAFLRDEMPATLTGIGIRRDPEDVKLLNRLVDVIEKERRV